MPPPAVDVSPISATRLQVMDAAAVDEALQRMTAEIIERHGLTGLGSLAIVGVYSRGVEIARRLSGLLADAAQAGATVAPQFGKLDISMHRDDLRQRARISSIQPSQLPIGLDKLTVILTDDVIFTGRTVRSALDALGEYGRPASIELAVLIDRGHRQLPIQPDFVGRGITTALGDRVLVRFASLDQVPDAVWVEQDEAPAPGIDK